MDPYTEYTVYVLAMSERVYKNNFDNQKAIMLFCEEHFIHISNRKLVKMLHEQERH